MKIAISYRRSDSQDITGRIFDRLVLHFGKDTVFRDIDSILPGLDFRDQIAEALSSTTVLLVIMGPRWLGQREGTDARIEDETDPVRMEVEMALNRKIPVVPVLVGGMKMPTAAQLPEGMKDFVYRHAVDVDGGRDFDHHMDGLVRALDRIIARINAATAPEPVSLSKADATVDVVSQDITKPEAIRNSQKPAGDAEISDFKRAATARARDKGSTDFKKWMTIAVLVVLPTALFFLVVAVLMAIGRL